LGLGATGTAATAIEGNPEFDMLALAQLAP
jgi:hypothetical protein